MEEIVTIILSNIKYDGEANSHLVYPDIIYMYLKRENYDMIMGSNIDADESLKMYIDEWLEDGDYDTMNGVRIPDGATVINYKLNINGN
jgi:hypothetical protein